MSTESVKSPVEEQRDVEGGEPDHEPEPEPEEHHESGGGAETAPVPLLTPIPDTDDEVYEEVIEEPQGKWLYVWVLASFTFVSLVVPLSILLLPYTPSAVVRRSSMPPWETVPPRTTHTVHKDEDPHHCKAQLEQDHGKPFTATAGLKKFAPDLSTRQHRRLFCVFDTKYHRASQPYLPKNVPYSYCTAILFYSISLLESGVRYKRPNIDPVYIEEFNDLKTRGELHRGSGVPVPVLLTVGGDPTDARNISRALRTQTAIVRAKDTLVELCAYHQCQGINLHWEYPTSPCGHPDDAKHLTMFFDTFSKWKSVSKNPSFMLTVTVSPEVIRRYSLASYLGMLDHVVVLTHRPASGRNVVECAGSVLADATAAQRIRAMFKGAADRKVCFSVSVGADFYNAEEPAVGSRVHRNATDNSTPAQRGKIGLYEVCRQSHASVANQECSLAFRGGGALFRVATYLTPDNVQSRMQLLYDRNQGDTCVAVFDMDLDDFAGSCRPPFGKQSALTAAILSS